MSKGGVTREYFTTLEGGANVRRGLLYRAQERILSRMKREKERMGMAATLAKKSAGDYEVGSDISDEVDVDEIMRNFVSLENASY